MKPNIRALVLHLSYPSRASYNQDWIDAFKDSPYFKADFLNIFQSQSLKQLSESIREYDAIILLHSCNADSLYYLSKYKGLLKKRKGILVSFVGNEYNMPTCFLSDKRAFLKAVDTDIIASQLLQETAEWLYQGCGKTILSIPHALNPTAFYPSTSYPLRKIDIGVRTFAYPAYLGDNDRNRLIKFFEIHAKRYKLTLNSSFSKRLGRKEWRDFLGNSRGVISTEAGTWFLEKDDAIIKQIKSFYKNEVTSTENSPIRKIFNLLPYQIKEPLKLLSKKAGLKVDVDFFADLDFKGVAEKFFQNVARCPFYSKCISSRHFDAVGTRTVQILLEGRYNDILLPDKHYLSLKKDFSNIDEVLRKFRDQALCEKLTRDTHEEFLAIHTYKNRCADLAKAIEEVS